MNRAGRLRAKLLITLAACTLALALAAPGAQAEYAVSSFGVSTSLAGQPSRQAGAHADLRTRIVFATDPVTGATLGDTKDVRVDLPPGLVGNPLAVPACPSFLLIRTFYSECPPSTMIGIARVDILVAEDRRHRLRHEDDEQILGRIDEAHRARRAGPVELARRAGNSWDTSDEAGPGS